MHFSLLARKDKQNLKKKKKKKVQKKQGKEL
jgi:hypothetical protein